MYGWLVRSMIRNVSRRRDEGDIGPLLSTFADDVHFVFPGDSSWAGDFHGKRDVEPWLRRFATPLRPLNLDRPFWHQTPVIDGPGTFFVRSRENLATMGSE